MMLLLKFVLFVAGAERAGALTVGDTCTADSDCTNLANSGCVNNKCTCNAGYYNSAGEYFCAQVMIGDACPDDGTGNDFCSAAITNSICDANSHHCICGRGYGFVFTEPNIRQCKPALTGPNCDTCKKTGGTCYDSSGNGNADTCGCEKYLASSEPLDSLVTGCDLKYTYTDGNCAKDGSIQCIDQHAECRPTPSDAFSTEYVCTCKPGYTSVFKPDDYFFQICVRTINKGTDPACLVCESNGGSCIDVNDDNVADGCKCPLLYSSSAGLSTACDTDHAHIICTATEMKMCIDAIANYDQYTAAEILNVHSQGYENDPECTFARVTGSPNTPVTLCISLRYNETKCGLKTVESKKLLSYSDWFLLRVNSRHQLIDVSFYSYCSYDKIANTYTGIQDMTAKKIVAIEGLHTAPVLSMTVSNQFGANVELKGVILYDDITLDISIIDNKAVYMSLRAEVCVVSNMLSLDRPDVQTSIFIRDACPVDSLLAKPINFYPDQYDPTTISTGFFPAPKFLNSDVIYFHCAVKVCLSVEDCAPLSCSSIVANRRRRSVGTIQTGPLKLASTISSRSHFTIRRLVAEQTLGGSSRNPDLTRTVIGFTVRDQGRPKSNNQPEHAIGHTSNNYAKERMVELQELVEKLKVSESSDPVKITSSSDATVVLCVIGSSLVTLVLTIVIYFICFVLRSYRKVRTMIKESSA